MQRFFQEIADELASIRATGDRPESVQLKWERFKAGAAADVQNLEAHNLDASPAMSGGSDLTQFEDAEDDVSVFSGSESSGQPYTPTSPMPPMMPSPTTKTAPLAVVDKFSETGHNRYNTEVTPTNRSSRRAPTAGVSPRPASLFSTATGSSAGSHFSGRRSVVSSRAQREADEAAQQVSISGRNSIAYAQTRPGAAPYTELGQSTGAPGTPMKEPTRLQKKNPGLGLNIESASLATSAGPPSAPPTPGANTSPKQSWFAGLFNWKPAVSRACFTFT